ncbi:MAG TPA: c-type cytochrome [Solimonas sp.]
MDHQNHDKVFFVNFSMVMGGLFAIFVVCLVAASLIDTGEIHADPDADARIEARIKPVGSVITDEAALLQLAAAAPKREPMTGEQVNTKLCAGCHMAGVMGAPKENDKGAWSARKSAAGGVDGLVASAIKGKGQMPAKGGDPSLTDDEVKAAVEVILKAAGV